MNANNLNVLTYRRLTSIVGGLFFLVFSSFYLFSAAAQTPETEKTPTSEAENLVLGRLLFIRYHNNLTGFYYSFNTVNADGSGESGLLQSPSIYNPSWSPDGTKIIYSSGVLRYINANGTGDTPVPNSPSSTDKPSWSPSGKIAFENRFSGGIFTINIDGTGFAPFPNLGTANSPVWSPDGSKLAYVKSGDIWVVNADGTNERQVTINNASDIEPGWAPDGNRIVFRRVGVGITVINIDGTNEMILSNNTSDYQPSWSPDGTKIAFANNTEPDGGIFLMDANGMNRYRILADGRTTLSIFTNLRTPRWQPVAQPPNTFVVSGRVKNNGLGVKGVTVNLSGSATASTVTDSLGFYRFEGVAAGGNYTVTPVLQNFIFTPASQTINNLSSAQIANFEVAGVNQNGRLVKNGMIAFSDYSNIYTINPDGSNLTNITNSSASNIQPNYSPNGSRIVFSTNRDGNYEIYRMNSDGSNPVRITNNPASDQSPAYSPDGATIVFTSDRNGSNREIFKMNADGSNQVRLTDNSSGGFDSDPSFSPDGQKIVFFDNLARRLVTINADGSNRQTLPGPSGGFQVYNRPAYSPDGTKIYYTYTSDPIGSRRSVWVMNADGSNQAQIISTGYAAALSPDGTKIASGCCQSSTPNQERLYTNNSDGTGPIVIPNTNSGAESIAWQPIVLTRRTLFDYDGDGRADVSVFRPAENKWFILQSADLSIRERTFATSGDVAVPADYDGDGKTDLAIWRPSLGDWWYLSSVTGGQVNVRFGQSGDIPRPSDFDGDGKTDFVLFRPSNGNWYRLTSTGAASFVNFGIAEDKPLVGDFDGDGKSDPAVFRPSNGDWWYRSSINGQFVNVHWGATGDIPVPGDYDADGKTDFVVFRPTDGGWYILYSTGSYTIATFGTVGDKPVAADFDGDGKTDIAVFRPSTGVWYLLQTTAGFGAVNWGSNSDMPTENVFLP